MPFLSERFRHHALVSEAERERWHIGGRHYLLTLASTPDSMELDVDDVGPGVGRGLILIASRDDASGEMTLRTFTSDPLPLQLVEKVADEARGCLPPIE